MEPVDGVVVCDHTAYDRCLFYGTKILYRGDHILRVKRIGERKEWKNAI